MAQNYPFSIPSGINIFPYVSGTNDIGSSDYPIDYIYSNDVKVNGISAKQRLLNNGSTGVLEGGVVTVNGTDTTKFDLSSGNGVIINNYTDPNNPTYDCVHFNASTGNSVLNLATESETYISITSSGTISKQNSDWTPDQHRDEIILAHANHASNTYISSVSQHNHVAYDYGQTTADFTEAIGIVNMFGNVYSANGANLGINKSAGESFQIGSNYANSTQSPNITTDGATVSGTFIYTYDDGTGSDVTSYPSTNIDPDQYDDGSGALQPVSNNKFTVQRLYHLPAGGGITIVTFGTAQYASIAEAEGARNEEQTVLSPSVATDGILRGWLIVEKGTTDLSVAADAKFITGGKFGSSTDGSASTSTTTLQQAYDNSATSEITTDAIRDGFTIKEGAGVGQNLFEGQDQNGTPVFTVEASGSVVIGSGAHVDFGSNPTKPAHTEGRMFYDSVDHTLAYFNDASGVTVNVGQETLIRVANNTGATLANGKSVYINGASGTRPTAALSLADSFSTARSVGIITDDILNGEEGYATTEGIVHEIDADSIGISGIAAGTKLYLDTITSGNATATRPSAPNYVVPIGYVSWTSGNTTDISITDEPLELLGYGTANQVLGVNSGATESEYKTISGLSNVEVFHASGEINISGSTTPTFDTVNSYQAVIGKFNEVPLGEVNGVNNAFDLAFDPYNNSLQLTINGVYMHPSGVGSTQEDYQIISGNTVSFAFPPPSGSALMCNYNFIG